MTLQEVGQYCECFVQKEKESFKQQAFMQYQIAEKLIAGLNMTKPKHIPFDKLFPQLIEEPKPLSEEEKKEQQVKIWLAFLG